MAGVFNPAPLSDIGHVIQLAIAPVFLLTAIATILNVLTGRLGRAGPDPLIAGPEGPHGLRLAGLLRGPGPVGPAPFAVEAGQIPPGRLWG